MLKYVIMTYRMHICDMFDEMHVIASRDLVMSFLNNFHWHHCLYVYFHLCEFHEVLGSDWVLTLEFSLKSHSQ